MEQGESLERTVKDTLKKDMGAGRVIRKDSERYIKTKI